MKRKKKYFTTDMRAAKVAAAFGVANLTDEEANQRANAPVPLRRMDSGNLARVAKSLESIAAYMKRGTESMERQEQESLRAAAVLAKGAE